MIAERLRLPAEPAHLHEVEWWEIARDGVRHRRAVYHVHSTWEEGVRGTEYEGAGRRGVDFDNHWQYFDEGRFVGRSSNGWLSLRTPDDEHLHLTRREALCELSARLHRRTQRLLKELGDTVDQLRRTHEELG